MYYDNDDEDEDEYYGGEMGFGEGDY